MSELEKLTILLDEVPKIVQDDVRKRVRDWKESGGGENDRYITQQINYVNRYINSKR